MAARLPGFLRPAPPAPEMVRDPQEIARQSRYWRMRILWTTLIGYAIFYLVRKNLPLAMPMMERELGIGKAQLGLFITLHGFVYGISKFGNGFLGDRANPRYLMAIGLVLAAAMNIGFGLSASVFAFALFWLLNGWFQGMGFPPCARSITHWFEPRERGTWFSVWNTSHSIGAAVALVLCSGLVLWNWRLCFLVPAAIAVAGAVGLVIWLRDTPESLGLPPVREEGVGPAGEEGDFRGFLVRKVLLNPMIWVLCVANFFVYTVRYALLDWGPTILTEMKGVQIQHAGVTVAAYEVAGVIGMLLSGWMTDRVFGGRAGRACVFWMLLCVACTWAFWKVPTNSPIAYTAVLCGIGFSIYGPQCLVGVIAANLATRRAAASAIGLTGLFGYLSTGLSGWGFGRIAQQFGWNPVFHVLLASCAAATLLFVLCWNAGSPTRERAFPVLCANEGT